MKKWALFGCILILSSCIGIESQIVLKQDGSGQLILSYKISQLVKDLDTENGGKSLPLPLSQDIFTQTVENIPGLKLSGLSEREDSENIYIEAEIDFDSIEAINQISSDMNMSLSTEQDITVFRQILYSGLGEEEISQDSLVMLDTFFDGYDLFYSFKTPSPVRSHSLGELSADERTVSYRISIAELIQTPEAVIFEVKW